MKNGNKKDGEQYFTVSFRNADSKSYCRAHNRRDSHVVCKEPHIDSKGYHRNFIDIDPEVAYDTLFMDSITSYDNKQKRNDRRIKNSKNYYQKVGSPVHECIVGVYGNISKFMMIRILWRFLKRFIKRNKNMYVIGAYVHFDETSPHMHLDYIPFKKNCNRGLAIQKSLSGALLQQGFNKTPSDTKRCNNLTRWQERERKELVEIAKDITGMQLRVVNSGEKHRPLKEYKIVKEKCNELELERRVKAEELEATKKELEAKKAELEITNRELSFQKSEFYEYKKGMLSMKNEIYDMEQSLEESKKRQSIPLKKVFGHYILPEEQHESYVTLMSRLTASEKNLREERIKNVQKDKQIDKQNAKIKEISDLLNVKNNKVLELKEYKEYHIWLIKLLLIFMKGNKILGDFIHLIDNKTLVDKRFEPYLRKLVISLKSAITPKPQNIEQAYSQNAKPPTSPKPNSQDIEQNRGYGMDI